MTQLIPNGADALDLAQTGPPLPDTLQLLAPLAPTLEKLDLGGNELGGTITGELLAPFTKLTELDLGLMGLEGAHLPYARSRSELRSKLWLRICRTEILSLLSRHRSAAGRAQHADEPAGALAAR